MTVSRILSNFSRWPLFLTYVTFLYIAFTLPPEQIPEVLAPVDDQAMHFLDFLLLALFAFRTFHQSSLGLFQRQAGFKACGFSLSYGAFLEGIQGIVPGRQMSFGDWIVDALGVLAALVIFKISKLTRTIQHVRVPPSKNP